MGAGQGWTRLYARVSVGHPPFWEPAQPPTWGPSRVLGYMVSARQVHLPHYLCAAHASTLLSPAPSAPYGNDLLLPDLSDTHGSPSAYVAMAAGSPLQRVRTGPGTFTLHLKHDRNLLGFTAQVSDV